MSCFFPAEIHQIGDQNNKYVQNYVACEFYTSNNGTQACFYFESSDGLQTTAKYNGDNYKTFNMWIEPTSSDTAISYVNYFGDTSVISSDAPIELYSASDFTCFDITRATVGDFLTFINSANLSYTSGYIVLGPYNEVI